jgi:hypothetical protein
MKEQGGPTWGSVAASYKHGNKTMGFIKGEEFLSS